MEFNPKTIDALIAEKPEDRGVYLDLLPEKTALQLLRTWASDERLKVTDIALLPMPWHTHLSHYVAGNPRKNIRGTDRAFFVAPNPDYRSPDFDRWPIRATDPVMLENGTFNSIRQYKTISKPMALPAPQAILAMTQYGPMAENKHQRDRLIEIDASEFGLWATRNEAALRQVEATKAAAEAERVKEQAQLLELEAELKRKEAEHAALVKEQAQALEDSKPDKDPPKAKGKKGK